jgi:two-component system OmpR family sensor kinase
MAPGTPLMIETVRARLTLWYVSILGAALIVVAALVYVLLARTMYARVDEALVAGVQIAITSLANDRQEGQDQADAARSTVGELSSTRQMVAIYDGSGQLLAEGGRDSDLELTLPPLPAIPENDVLVHSVYEIDDDDRHRLGMRRVSLDGAADYVVVLGSPMESLDEELASLRRILAYIVPVALIIAGFGGWFLARRSLSPVVSMADRARQIGGENLSERLPVANPRDELGHLAATFNELLGRLERSLGQQRQFMADASHELRTPVATARTAASVALQQPHRDEHDYRQTLEIIEQQTARLSRVVDDMFTLARADAGNYPIRRMPMYLDEVVEDIVRAARVIASTKDVTVDDALTVRSASFFGDEELIHRMIGNLIDNAVRHAPPGSSVRVDLDRSASGYVIGVRDQGPGVPDEIRPYIFERFYRGDAARQRGPFSHDGAGLGLALARWIARSHGGDVDLVRSSESGSTFVMALPSDTES